MIGRRKKVSLHSSLRQIKGFHDKSLEGERRGPRSSRLGLKYRVIYRVKGQDQGTLSDELFDIEGNEDWISKSIKWTNESFVDYCSMGMTFETHLPNLDENTRGYCDKSLSLILNETADMPKELGTALDSEYYVGSISPTTITTILDAYNLIDHEALRESISEDVLCYLEEWVAVLKEARLLERGLLVHVG